MRMREWTSGVVLTVGALTLLGCNDDTNFRPFDKHEDAEAGEYDSGFPPFVPPEPYERDGSVPGVCPLADCPRPFIGVACCTPLAQCGTDLLGLGLACIANPGERIDTVCDLMECPEPPFGIACCTPVGRCGTDLYGTGLTCYANAPPVRGKDGGLLCNLEDCPIPAAGYACCTIDGRCGTDLYGWGQCLPNPIVPDGGYPVPSNEPPDDPSVTGECPSYLGAFGPVWGCCSPFGVCGTFQFGACLLPIGTPLPVGPVDEDSGDPSLCTPPPKK